MCTLMRITHQQNCASTNDRRQQQQKKETNTKSRRIQQAEMNTQPEEIFRATNLFRWLLEHRFHDIPKHNWECLRGKLHLVIIWGWDLGFGWHATDKMKCPSSCACCLLSQCATTKSFRSVEIKIYGKCRHCLGTQLTLYICASISIRLNVSDVEWACMSMDMCRYAETLRFRELERSVAVCDGCV